MCVHAYIYIICFQEVPLIQFFKNSKKDKTLPLEQSCDPELLENENKKSLNELQIDEKPLSSKH